MLQMIRMPDGTVKLLLEGKERMRARQYTVVDSMFSADLVSVRSSYVEDDHLKALLKEVLSVFEDYVNCRPRLPQEMIQPIAAAAVT